MKTDNYIIKNVLKGIPDWVVTSLSKYNCYIAGGTITSVVNSQDINDYDIYFPNKESLVEVLKDFAEEDPHCSFISDKSITYSLDAETTLQFIYYDFYEVAEDIFKHFDYTVNMAAINLEDKSLVMDDNFLLHNSQRYLSFNKSTKFPMISALRVQKYQDKGYKITRSQYMKVLMAVNKLELKSWEDFSAAVGNLYGFNFVAKDKMQGDFSLDKAFEIIENTDFDGSSKSEYKFEPSVVAFVLSDKPITYARLFNGQIIHQESHESLSDLIELGSVKAKEVGIKEVLGDKLYKWVNKDLTSIHDSSFQYELGKEVIGLSSSGFFVRKENVLYCCTKDGVNSHHFAVRPNSTYNNKSRVCIELEYKEEDVFDVNGNEIQIKRLTPVKIIGENTDQVDAYFKGDLKC